MRYRVSSVPYTAPCSRSWAKNLKKSAKTILTSRRIAYWRRVQGSAYVYTNCSALPIVLPLTYSSSCSHRKRKYAVYNMGTPYQNKKVSSTTVPSHYLSFYTIFKPPNFSLDPPFNVFLCIYLCIYVFFVQLLFLSCNFSTAFSRQLCCHIDILIES